MKRLKRLVFLTPFAVATASSADNGAITFASSPEQTSLVELYTSEGCSSCPPAENWLRGVSKSTRLWRDFVPVVFHVDYWDYLGWRDPWGDKANSERQRSYAALWASKSIYTPEFVINGREWRGWPTSDGLPMAAANKVGILKVSSRDTNEWKVTFTPAVPANVRHEVHAALLISGGSSRVRAGENRGRELRHDFVVKKLVSAALIQEENSETGSFILAIEDSEPAGDRALAVWVAQSGHLEALQTTGGPITARLAK